MPRRTIGHLEKKKRTEGAEISSSTPASKVVKKSRRELSGVKGDLKHQSVAPSPEVFAAMEHYDKVHWMTSEEDQTTYKINQDVMIVPNSKDIRHNKKNAPAELGWEDLWYGRILDIRGDGEVDPEVWFHIAWYYSPKWFMTVKAKETRLKDLGRLEMIFAPEHQDIIHAHTLNGVEIVYKFKEEDFDAEDIPNESFYTRSTYDTTKRIWLDPPPKRHCLCLETFKLWEKQKRVLHYCPRQGCHKWYHESCLKESKLYQTHDRVDLFEKEWQVSFDEDQFEKIVTEVAGLPREAGVYTAKYEGLSPVVLAYARQPIVKGGDHRVHGNMGAVLRARWIVHQAVRRGVMPPTDYEKYVEYRPEPEDWDSDSDSDAESEGSAVETAIDENEQHEHIDPLPGKKRKRPSESSVQGPTSMETELPLEPRVSGIKYEHTMDGRQYLAYKCPNCREII
ncbi:hypothetical protein DACRYDRAFT_20290 [Dacryopinax primogenitus]|uniref:BAH domain-containing protein n=1 Tax=Dacryopinax primogenitus (strain DJM 731) TaxID=1858805 RepID=M5G8S7_DACPD|nr:uncharacterized protein DACRYDRAFT_20290 [Dacryopinax primogenitus]EJU04585.1 hypothetical protein DACRYDRAFT_20290 [Dacryopinax primogenitus]